MIHTLAPLVREKIDLLSDFLPLAGWFFRPLEFAEGAAEKLAVTPGAAEALRVGGRAAGGVEPDDVEHIEAAVPGSARRRSAQSRKLCSPCCDWA